MHPFDGTAELPRRPVTLADAWQATAAGAAGCVQFFDFDGTLAPIRTDPDKAEPAPGIVDVLIELARAVHRIVIVSARPVKFLQARLSPLSDVDFYGLYGLEWARSGDAPIADPEAEAWVAV